LHHLQCAILFVCSCSHSRCSFYQQVCESSAWLIRLAEDMLIHRFAASTHCLHFGSDLNIGDHHSKRATISSTQHCLHLILRLRPLSSSYLCCSNTRKQ
uniref:Uncharacterized protein n=1 Tax=Oryza glaberrima TaxID=4538 RepID=I1PNI3_ORYGL